MTTPPQPRRVILVDGNDVAHGVAGVHASHDLPGAKHRAYTAVLWDSEGRILLAKRAAEKRLWPGYWDATVASHPQPGESHTHSGERRLTEELGVKADLALRGRFDYAIAFGANGAENEVCATLIGQLGPDQVPRPAPGEVSEVRAVAPGALLSELGARPSEFCPWMFLALSVLTAESNALPQSLDATVAALAQPSAGELLERGLKAHFGSATWRLLDSQ